MGGAVGQQRVPKEFIESYRIPVPPLPEQQRIVGILDEAFEGIATAKANAEKNLQNARALFESHLQSVFTQRGKGWVEKRLGDLSRINYGYTESASAEKVGPHFLRITDIQDNFVDWATVPYCPIDAGDLPKYKLADGDIVFARTGATTGKSYLVTNPPDAVFASYLIRVQLQEKELLPQFVNLFFQTHSYLGHHSRWCFWQRTRRLQCDQARRACDSVSTVARRTEGHCRQARRWSRKKPNASPASTSRSSPPWRR